jgi:uncharacterized protein (DUF2235 family)
MTKNIVVLCDGTGNQLKTKGNTNVVRLYGLLKRDDPQAQVAFYDPGVGTMGSQGATTELGRKWTKLMGLAFGYGLKANVIEGYEFIMSHYQPGDRVFLFGFSRGAYTVRAIAGLINHVGLLPPGSENLLPYAMKLFWHTMEKGGKRQSSISDEEWDLARSFSETFARPDFQRKRANALAYLGAWDTVNATGSLRRRVVLPYTARLEVVTRTRHAVAIDEERRDYRPNLLKLDSAGFTRRADGELHEVWFAGVHSYVGGDHKLSDITLQWVVEGALEQGLLVRSGFARYRKLPEKTAYGPVGENKGLWRLRGLKRRTLRPAEAIVHKSVIIKRVGSDYDPENVPADPPEEPWPHLSDGD